jgi:hypothetical protein
LGIALRSEKAAGEKGEGEMMKAELSFHPFAFILETCWTALTFL